MSWPSSRLADLCDVITKGTTPTTLGFDFSDKGIPFLRVQNIEGGSVNYERDTLFIDERTHQALERSQIRPGDVLVSIAGTIGRAGVVPQNAPPLNCNQAIAIVRTDGSVFRPFLRHWLESPAAQMEMRGATVTGTISNLSLTEVGNLRVTVPPVEDQRRLAAILDQTEALRAKRRAALAQLRTLEQAFFFDLFGDPVANPMGWTRVPFGELLTKIDSGWSPTCLDRPVADDEWGVLKLGAVTWCEYNADENKALPPNVAPDPELEVKPGDLLFTRKSTYELVAACALVRATPPRLMMSDLIFRFRLRPDANLDACFLHQLLIYPTKRREIQKLAGGSAGSMPNISKARLEVLPIEVPPHSIQKDFASRVTAAEKLKTSYRASLGEMDTLFAALQHRAFRGEL